MTHMANVRTSDGSTMKIHGLTITGEPRLVPMTVLIQTFISEGALVVVSAVTTPAPVQERKVTMNQRPKRRQAELGGQHG